MKKTVALLLAAALLFALSACKNTEPEGQTQMPNPIVDVENEAAFEALGVKLSAPEGASDVVYQIISDEIAQIVFTFDGTEYSARGAKDTVDSDIAGVYSEFEETELGIDVDAANGGVHITVKTTTEGGSRLASWSANGCVYTLFTETAVSDDAITAVSTAVAMLTIG